MADDREGRALKGPTRKRPVGRISREERELWDFAAREIKPIKGKKGRVHAALEDAETSESHKREPAKHAAHSKPHAPPSTPATPAKPSVTVTRAAPRPTEIERRKARQIGTGRIDIEARIDLHGMRQSEAHSALRRFLKTAHAGGKRWVLVITGKGAAARTALDERERDDAERGVLRRNVPRWMAEPELAQLVVGFTTAAIKHGGEGALYVQLRRSERT
jgi:DNA-nicking Smr family endonuclease